MTDVTPTFQFVDDPREFRAGDALVLRIPAKARGKEKLFGVLVKGLRLPSYFGWNWDALDECLNDLSWLSDETRVIIVHEGLPFSCGGEQLPAYLNLLRDVVGARRKSNVPPSFEVVFPEAVRDVVESSSPA